MGADDRAATSRRQQSAVRRIDLRAAIEAAMAEQRYTDAGTAPREVLRFLAAPTDVNWGGKVHGGIVMRWIDEAAYVGGVAVERADAHRRLLRRGPVLPADLHRGPRRGRGPPAAHRHLEHAHQRARALGRPEGRQMHLTTHCLTVFVALDVDGAAAPISAWVPASDEDRALAAHALDLVALRSAVDRSAI